ncbi:MAG: rhodanese-like domain-containing protein [Pseudomonadota bacterium]
MKTVHDMVQAAKTEIREIPLNEAEDAIKQADLVIDVREEDEFHAGHIPGALNIPRGILEFKLTNDPAMEDRALNMVIYCKNSGRSALSAKAMQEMGYIHVQSICGGIEAWQEAGKPVVKPQLPDFD